MTRRWVDIDLRKIIPEEIPDTLEAINEEIIEPLVSALDSLKDLLGLAELALLARTDPLLLGLTLVIEQVEEIINNLKSNYGIHAFFVPILRTNNDVPKLTVNAVNAEAGGFPILQVNPPIQTGAGGTWGFYAAFANSFDDQGDLNRPVYNETQYVACLTLLFGASSLGDLISQAFTLFKLLGNLVPVPLDGFILPVPQNLKIAGVAPIIRSDDETTDIGDEPDNNAHIALSWDRPKLDASEDLSRLFTRPITLDIETYSVYLKPDEDFTTTDTGDTLAIYEIFRGDLPTLVSTKIITGLDPARTYYFAVGFNVIITQTEVAKDPWEILLDPEVIETTLEHYDISNSVRLQLNERGATPSGLPKGTLPDWTALSSATDVFPPIEQLLDLLLDLLSTLKDSIKGVRDELLDYIQDIEDFVDFYQRRAAQIQSTIDALVAVLRALRLQVYGYGFYGKGGSSFLLSEMNRALFSERVSNRPPFESGDDFVASIVLVAGAPSLASLDVVLQFLRLLFGDVFSEIAGGNVVTDPQDPDTGIEGETAFPESFQEALASIESFTEFVDQQTDDLIEQTGLGDPPEGETDSVTVDLPEVDTDCLT